jgi:predicted lipoprotein
MLSKTDFITFNEINKMIKYLNFDSIIQTKRDDNFIKKLDVYFSIKSI